MSGLSILIPVYNRPVAPLVQSLLAQAGAWPGPVEVWLLDDGSAEETRRQNRPLGQWPGVRYEELPANVGRAAVRNALAARATHPWLLLLDNDSLLPDADFIGRYATAATAPGAAPVLVGGTTYAPTPPPDPALRLRWLYGRAREMAPAAVRRCWPAGQLTINNALVRAELLRRFPLDENLRGYGHEDTRFGLALAAAGVPLTHLDNPVLHDGLEPAAVFLDKTRQAVRNLAAGLRRDELGADTRLARTTLRLRRLGVAAAAQATLAALEPALRRHLLGSHPSLRALDLLKLRWLLAELAA